MNTSLVYTYDYHPLYICGLLCILGALVCIVCTSMLVSSFDFFSVKCHDPTPQWVQWIYLILIASSCIWYSLYNSLANFIFINFNRTIFLLAVVIYCTYCTRFLIESIFSFMPKDTAYGSMYIRVMCYALAFANPANSISWIMYALHSWRLYHLTLRFSRYPILEHSLPHTIYAHWLWCTFH